MRRGVKRPIEWWVIDRMPFYNDDTPPQHAFRTLRDGLNWIVEYLLTHPDHLQELRAHEYERRRAKRDAAKSNAALEAGDDDALAAEIGDDEPDPTTNNDNTGEQQ